MKVFKRMARSLAWRLRREAIKTRFLIPGPRIIYALTPPPRLSNLGDHAQVVAIYGWLSRSFPHHNVIELNKDEVIHTISSLERFIRKDDCIILHSGGNLGDRGIWSETGRRLMIQHFPENRILSMPQTINFSVTPRGIEELEKSKRIYNHHKNLVVVARDNRSYELAQAYFPSCTVDRAPDFVLSYDYTPGGAALNGKVLFCLREDDESAMSRQQREELLAICTIPFDLFDTTIPSRIAKGRRKENLDKVLELFSQYDCVVTDRFHGLIFSVLCKKPTVVLPTVDHKLTSAFDWFEDVKFVRFARTVHDVPDELEKARAVTDLFVPCWNEKYFDVLADYIR